MNQFEVWLFSYIIKEETRFSFVASCKPEQIIIAQLCLLTYMKRKAFA